MTQNMKFDISINAPVSKVRDIMLWATTYGLRTKAFCDWSTYHGTREQWSEMRFLDAEWRWMIGVIVKNELHKYISIKYIGEINIDHSVKNFVGEWFENYTFASLWWDATKLDIELIWLPDEWAPMFAESRPKALALLQSICESDVVKLVVSTIIHAPIQKVRDARNNDQVHRCFASDDRCCPKATNDLCVDGILCCRMEAKDGSFGFDMTGKYSIVEPMTRISYTMGEMKEYFLPAGREVDVVFEKLWDNQTKIIETFDAEQIHSLEMQQRWRQAILENFKKYVEKI